MGMFVREAIEQFLEKYRISRKAGFILAVSGGADSISMLHAFRHLHLKILVLHCNFSLRGQESDLDEQFVGRFCESYGIAHSAKKFDTPRYAREKGLSIEMAARQLRYEWFAEMQVKKRMDYIAVAHHADDVAETVLINLCRGTGIKGLTGIKPVNGKILRPLLECSRTDILQYISEHRLDYRTDSTNRSLDYIRNQIRHQVIPVFKKINPSFLDTVTENCDILKETEQIFNYGIRQLQSAVLDREEDETRIHIAKTLASPAPRTLLFETLHPLGFNKTQIQDMLNSSAAIPGKQFTAGSHVLVKGRTHWHLYDASKNRKVDIRIPQPANFTIDKKSYTFRLLPNDGHFQIPTDPGTACLDADKLQFPLQIRNWQAGDYFCPIGMKKSKKKVSDFFTDQKFSSKQKKECLLLLSRGEIVWIIGHRLDDRFKITPLTKKIWVIRETQNE